MNKLVCMFFILPLLCYSQKNKETDLEKEGLLGKVKQVSEKLYSANKVGEKILIGNRINTFSNIFLTKYNNSGAKTEEDYCNLKDSIYMKEYYLYDAKGCLIKLYRNYSTYIDSNIYTNNSKGELSEINYYQSGPNNFHNHWNVKYEYNNYGDMIGEYYYSIIKRIYQYDSKGNIVETKNYRDDTLREIDTYKYDDKGKKIEKREHEVGYDTTYMTILDNITTYKYNSKGIRLETTCYTDTSFERTTKYDDLGNEIEHIYIIDFPPVIKDTYLYEYDKNNNWIKKTEYGTLNGERDYTVTIREIEYY